MKTIEYKNILFYIGQNAQDNWDILEHSLKINENYLWFHLNSFPSPYVIMCCTLEDICSNDINDIFYYAGDLCKQNSKYKNLKDIKICYTSLKKLKKTNKIGEIIITGKRNTFKI
jgi:hypothetical protein